MASSIAFVNLNPWYTRRVPKKRECHLPKLNTMVGRVWPKKSVHPTGAPEKVDIPALMLPNQLLPILDNLYFSCPERNGLLSFFSVLPLEKEEALIYSFSFSP